VAAPKPRAPTVAKPSRNSRRPGRVVDTRDDAWADPGSRGEKLSIFEFPTYMIERLSGLVKRSFMPSYIEPFGIGIPEWRVMGTIGSHTSLSFNEICGILTMDRAQVSRTLGTLLKKSFVERIRTERSARGRGHGRKQTKLVLSADGLRIYKQILPVARQHQMVLLSALDPQERAIVHDAIWKLIATAQQFEAACSVRPTKHEAELNDEIKPARTSSSSNDLDACNLAPHRTAGP
jgi:DNA-binding MarR family transcriptional regulator